MQQHECREMLSRVVCCRAPFQTAYRRPHHMDHRLLCPQFNRRVLRAERISGIPQLLFSWKQTAPLSGQQGAQAHAMYLFIIFLCAFGLSLTSTLSYADYFTSPLFWKYIVANSLFLNFLQPSLPGVFEGEPFAMSAVNGAVWTMKVDLLLTLSVPVVHYLYTRFRLNKAYLFATIIALSVLYKSLFTYLYITTGSSIYMILGKQFFGQLSYFYVGAAICFYFDSFMKHKWTILAIVLPLFIFSKQIPYFNVFLEPVVFAPLVIWVSMVGSWGYKIIKTDNVSYGIYLYHFPVIQLCILLGIKQFSPWTAFLIVTAVTTILALTAWKLIGRHFIKSRKKLTA